MMWPTDAEIYSESPWYWTIGPTARGDGTEILSVNFSGNPAGSDPRAKVVSASIDSEPSDD